MTAPKEPAGLEIGALLSRALSEGWITNEDTAAVFFDLGLLAARLERLRRAFPTSALHTTAIKANPLLAVLKRMAGWGAGAEAASLPELKLAARAGFPAETIVFDSPAKTREEIRYALAAGAYLNADNLDEVERIADAIGEMRGGPGGQARPARAGLRLNPQVGTGRISATSTAGVYSKFGVPIAEQRDALRAAFARHDWLRGVHVHVGSQACAPELLVAGIRRTLDFLEELRRERGATRPPIDTFDIGGGLPVAYRDGETEISARDYAGALASACPALFDGRLRIVTEFGRHLHAHSGWVASRVEYVKTVADIPTAILHVGADLFSRECGEPDFWYHHVTVHDDQGRPRGAGERLWNLAGPLCFSGDMPAVGVPLPEVHPGDFVVLHDAGAYTFSMASRYNSRPSPKVIGYSSPAGPFEVLRPRESIEGVLSSWS